MLGGRTATGHQSESNSSVRELLLLISWGWASIDEIKILPSKDYHVENASPFARVKKGTHSAELGALVPVFEKLATVLKLKQKLLTYKSTIQLATFNVRTLNRIGQLPELAAFAIDHNKDIICIQEHRYNPREENIGYHNMAMNGRLSQHLYGKTLLMRW